MIDDYRYDEPNYFTDKRVPNITLEVTTVDGNVVSFRASSQGGGVSLEYLDVQVALEIGGDPERLERENGKIYQKIAARTLKPEETIARLETVERKLASNRPGTYRVRAVYRPNIAGKWKGELATEPVTIVITDAK